MENENNIPEEKLEETIDSLAVDSTLDDEEVTSAAETLNSPEMLAKIQTMHDQLPLVGQIEAALFASSKPLNSEDFVALISHQVSVAEIQGALLNLKRHYDERQGGFILEYLKGHGYQFQTAPVAAPIMARMFASRPKPLSRAAMETLAIIAYRQPCTRAVIEFIRGVDAGSIIKNLMEKNFIRCTGRKEDAPGKPMLFGTTDEFLHVFSLPSIKELPPLSSFQASSDTLKEALKELDAIDGVAIDDFVGDETEVAPEVSEGLLVPETGSAPLISEDV